MSYTRANGFAFSTELYAVSGVVCSGASNCLVGKSFRKAERLRHE